MGFSIGKVFQPIERELKLNNRVDSFYMPVGNYSLKGLVKNILAARKVIKLGDYDIVHITGTEHYLVPFLFGIKSKIVVTVHDFGSLAKQKSSIHAFFKKLLFISSLKYADAITYISKQTKDEAKKLLGNLKVVERIIFDAIDDVFQYSPKIFNETKPVVLHIGTKPNKNLSNTILALKKLNVHLRIIGRLSPLDEIELQRSGLDYSNAFNLTDLQIYEEYKRCDIVNFPSLYEGFGMPILEGNAVGRVVVTSKLSPMKDVADGAAVLVNPLNSESIRLGYEYAIKERTEFIEKGLQNVKRFNKKKIAQQYLDLYRTILKVPLQ